VTRGDEVTTAQPVVTSAAVGTNPVANGGGSVSANPAERVASGDPAGFVAPGASASTAPNTTISPSTPLMPDAAGAPSPGAKELFENAPSGAPLRTGLRYRVILQKPDQSQVEVDPATTSFKSGDGVKLAFDANIDGYLYVVSQGSSGAWTVLFPGPEINGGRNAIRRGEEYTVPDREDWFEFDKNVGTERLFVFLSKQPMAQLPGFNRAVTQPETIVASVIDDLQRRFPSRDLFFQKAAGPVNTKGIPTLSNYVVNPSEMGQSVSASITLKHPE
jgi:hypothetical protein